MADGHHILIVGRDQHRRRPFYLVRCTCGMYTTAPFHELSSASERVQNLAGLHGIGHPGGFTISGPFPDYIISERP